MPAASSNKMKGQWERRIFMLCAFTGHRPQRLPWGGREEDPRCHALKILLSEAVEAAATRGCTGFLCGMALGCDTWFAEIVLEKGLKLAAMLPCPGQADHWPKKDRARYEGLLARCDEIIVLEPAYSDGCMLRRNRAMIERADILISVYDGCGGGTGNTVSYAKERGLEIMPIWV